MTRTATTWGITGPQFLWLYGALAAALAATAAVVRKRALGPRDGSNDPTPQLGVYKVAMLNGGDQLAITTAATKLHRDGVLCEGDEPRTHVVDAAVPLGAQADPLERAVYHAVRRDPGISTDQLRAELAGGDALASLRRDLTGVGLLVDEDAARDVSRLWRWGALLALFGAVRIYAGVRNDKPVVYLAVLVAAVVLGTIWLGRGRLHATARGRAIVHAHRDAHATMQRTPSAGDSVLAVALFGGAALWLADPGIASALDVPREDHAGWGGAAGAGCSAGGGACSGGFIGGGGSCGGGGGCGGGGCGGG
jgi:uncharacterized protein (TIGR04222 family)